MGVVPEAGGQDAGEFLLRASIEHAYALLGAERLFLLTNRRSGRAIRLYERNGFAHDLSILTQYAGEYARCDVAMRHVRSTRAPRKRAGRSLFQPLLI